MPFSTLQSAQYTIYDSKGSHYDWHRDIGKGDKIMKARVNVGIIQLSDPGDYKGGVLQIKYEDQVIDVMYRDYPEMVKDKIVKKHLIQMLVGKVMVGEVRDIIDIDRFIKRLKKRMKVETI